MTDFFKNLIDAAKQEDFADILERWMNTGVFKVALPEVHKMTECEHPLKWHPEGNVWQHIIAGLRNADWSDWPEEDLGLIRLATFFHDIGKPAAMKEHEDGTIRYIGHDAAGLRIFDEICEMHDVTDLDLIENIKFPIKNHMKLHLFDKMRQHKINKLVTDPKWPLLKAVGKADIYSRQFNIDGTPSHVDLSKEWNELDKYNHKLV